MENGFLIDGPRTYTLKKKALGLLDCAYKTREKVLLLTGALAPGAPTGYVAGAGALGLGSSFLTGLKLLLDQLAGVKVGPEAPGRSAPESDGAFRLADAHSSDADSDADGRARPSRSCEELAVLPLPMMAVGVICQSATCMHSTGIFQIGVNACLQLMRRSGLDQEFWIWKCNANRCLSPIWVAFSPLIRFALVMDVFKKFSGSETDLRSVSIRAVCFQVQIMAPRWKRHTENNMQQTYPRCRSCCKETFLSWQYVCLVSNPHLCELCGFAHCICCVCVLGSHCSFHGYGDFTWCDAGVAVYTVLT